MALSPDQIEQLVSEEGFKGPMEELGWRNRAYDDPEVCALRERLEREAGIPDLEVVDPATPGFAQRAADLLERDGFVVVKDVLDEARLETIRQGCEIAIREMVGRDPNRSGNRGSHRYTQRARARAASTSARRDQNFHTTWLDAAGTLLARRPPTLVCRSTGPFSSIHLCCLRSSPRCLARKTISRVLRPQVATTMSRACHCIWKYRPALSVAIKTTCSYAAPTILLFSGARLNIRGCTAMGVARR